MQACTNTDSVQEAILYTGLQQTYGRISFTIGILSGNQALSESTLTAYREKLNILRIQVKYCGSSRGWWLSTVA